MRGKAKIRVSYSRVPVPWPREYHITCPALNGFVDGVCFPLVDLLLLVHTQLAGAHVDQEEKTSAVMSAYWLAGVSCECIGR